MTEVLSVSVGYWLVRARPNVGECGAAGCAGPCLVVWITLGVVLASGRVISMASRPYTLYRNQVAAAIPVECALCCAASLWPGCVRTVAGGCACIVYDCANRPAAMRRRARGERACAYPIALAWPSGRRQWSVTHEFLHEVLARRLVVVLLWSLYTNLFSVIVF